MIETEVVSIGNLFLSEILQSENQTGHFAIPPIQRGYQWGVGVENDPNVDRSAYVLLKDLVNYANSPTSEEMPYYSGTIIVYKDRFSPEGKYQLMDGQQRWTSITAMMGVIHHLLDQSNNGTNLSGIKHDIKRRFLKSNNNTNRLHSSRDFDNEIIRVLTDFSGDFVVDENFQFTGDEEPPLVRYNMDEKTYNGTNLQCVVMYYIDAIRSQFNIAGPLSDLTDLVIFYEKIRDNVIVNLTLAPSPVVAHEMFITANTRGTPLNNFDILRGFLISREMELDLGAAEQIRTKIEATERKLNQYINEITSGNSDINKPINEVMAEIMSVFQGRRIAKPEVMFYIKKEVECLHNLDSILDFIEYIRLYFHYRKRIVSRDWNKSEEIGFEENLRLRYIGQKQYIPLYCTGRIALRLAEDENKEIFEANLLMILRGFECILMRTRLDMTKFSDFTKKQHSFLSRHANKIKETGLTSHLTDSILTEYAEMDENPNDLSNLPNFPWAPTRDSNKIPILISAFYAVEGWSDTGPILSGSGRNGTMMVGSLLPAYDRLDIETNQVWDYGGEARNRTFSSWTIGNLFLVRLNATDLRGLTLTQKEERINRFRQASAGVSVSGVDYLQGTDWNETHINHRAGELVQAFENRFPRDCRVNLIE